MLSRLQQELLEHSEENSIDSDHPDHFVGAHPLTAGIQTALERHQQPDLIDRLLRLLRVRPESSDDPRWLANLVVEVLERVALGTYAFNERPARLPVHEEARVVVVGDWGSGLLGALRVAEQMRIQVVEALEQGRQVHVVHLGDVCTYAGEKREYRHNVLAKGRWPVTKRQARGGHVYSWALNGNHDMFSGGRHYFETMLHDPRFRLQKGGGKPTSYFVLHSVCWNIIGLDTAWRTELLTTGGIAELKDPQADVVAQVVAEDPKRSTLLLSHHQLTSIYDPTRIGKELPDKLKPVLGEGRVKAWIWGHEHRAMGFKEYDGVQFPRCLGHGGMLTRYPSTPPALLPDGPRPPVSLWEAKPDPPLDVDGEEYYRNGFAVLDLHGSEIEVRYFDDYGQVVHTEAFG